MENNNRIPEWMQVYFWDVSWEKLDTRQYREFVIERLLNEGDHRSLAWLFKAYSRDTIKNTVKLNRNLSVKTARCWQNYFGLKEEELCCTGLRLAQTEKLF